MGRARIIARQEQKVGMSIISYSNKPIIASLLAALPLGSSVWPTSAQARFIGMHLGGPGGWRSFDHSSDLHERPYASRWHDDWYSGAIADLATGAIFGGAIASEEAAPLYAVPVYPAVPSADPYRLAYCSQRYHSFDPATGTYLGYDGARHVCH